MSMKKKSPGKRWITGVARAQLQRCITHLNGLLRANLKQPVAARPLTNQQQADFNSAVTDCQALLVLKS